MPSEIVIPRLGWSMEEGTFVAWLRKDGDQIQPGDVLFELEGEKAVQEIEAVDAGTLHIPANAPAPGTVVQVGSVVGYLLAPGEVPPTHTPASSPTPTKAPAPPAQQSSSSPPQPRSAPLPESLGQAPSYSSIAHSPAASPALRRMARERGLTVDQLIGSGPGGKLLPHDLERNPRATHAQPALSPARAVSSPRARRIARELGIDWTRLTGTGVSGRIRERDVRAAAQAAPPPPGPNRSQPIPQDPDAIRIPTSPRRRMIAQRMLASARETAPVTLHARADATRLVQLREQWKAAGTNPLPGYQDILSKLVAASLLEHPLLAAVWDETTLILPPPAGIHIGMAVDTPEGLLVPVLRNVAQRPLSDVVADSRQLIQNAREGRLKADQMTGGVFTMTNLGSFGIEYFTPIINLPQTAILGLGTLQSRSETAPNLSQTHSQSAPSLTHSLALSLTFDHRVVDGAPAARFLQHLIGLIANPETIVG